MQLVDLIQRAPPPVPWAEGDNIPWYEPGFSNRMLAEHLSQSHDAASRRFEIIDRQVDWIHTSLLACQPTTLLDLGCGPGLSVERLVRLGLTCHGIDYSPASIEYAFSHAHKAHLDCTYICQDIRQADYPHGTGLVMLIYGEFNVFCPVDANLILGKAWHALKPGGLLLLEPHPFDLVHHLGEKPASWYSSAGGLFSEHPHVVMQENFWDANSHAATARYYILDAHTGQVCQYSQSFQAYHDDDYRSLLALYGFESIQILPGLMGGNSPKDLLAITARKQS